MKLVYIAGPFNGKTDWDRAQNVRRAEAVALLVAKGGAMPVCPQANSSLFFGQCTESFWYEGTMELLYRCDAVVMVPGWEGSKGAKAERDEAARIGMPVFTLRGGRIPGLQRFVEAPE